MNLALAILVQMLVMRVEMLNQTGCQTFRACR